MSIDLRMSADFNFIYLASQSPRRRQLLDQIGVPYELLLPEADEDAEALEAVCAGESAKDYVQRVTCAKLDAALARRARRALPEAPVLCADTTVALGRRILGKPADAVQAREMLMALSGREHRVLTAVAVGQGARRELLLNVSRVRFSILAPDQIDRYVASGEPFGKAGAYGIQSRAAVWIDRIVGSYSSIMGLPLHETGLLLQRFGVRV
ncbi:MAG: Maf-like protein [Caldimonas sp.]|uniref:Maf family protein n=1 Tax=Caldimonas taiwanensis TaxID=307483 RepID=UPI000AA9226C|nr:Maf family protein [Caldimonas taiwanensis]GIX25878.1 MAG: Maf-like protein [Caldimonas sp.]